jgi:hypothetical protein
MANLAQFRRNVYSQNGEDGVIAEIFQRLPDATPKWYVEFGAWDGRYGSNRYALALAGWRGVMIEGDTRRFERLQRTARRFSGRMLTAARSSNPVPISSRFSGLSTFRLSSDCYQ